VIRLGTLADLSAATEVFRSASLSNAGDRDNMLAHPEYLVLGPEGLAEGRTYVAEEDGSLAGFATWAGASGIIELEDLFVHPGWMRRGIATALVNRIAQVLRARGVERLEVTANPHALGFYRAAGFVDCGVADTDFGTAPRMVLAIGVLRVSFRPLADLEGSLHVELPVHALFPWTEVGGRLRHRDYLGQVDLVRVPAGHHGRRAFVEDVLQPVGALPVREGNQEVVIMPGRDDRSLVSPARSSPDVADDRSAGSFLAG
jgi:GNAT superfamily N-acetyltransferase